MTGPVGADDPALEQARLAQLALHAYLDGWRGRYALAAGAGTPPSPTPENTLAMAPTADHVETISARPGLLLTRVEEMGVRATDEALPRVSPKPVPPALAPGQRDEALSKARLLNSKRKEVRDQLRQGSLSLVQALAQDGEAARGMRVVTVVRALPGIGAATAARLMREAGIDAARRVGALTAGQAARLLAAVAAVDAERTAGHCRRPERLLDDPLPGRLTSCSCASPAPRIG